jgi:hypothetical protein
MPDPTRTAAARETLAEAVHDDLMDQADRISGALEGLEELGTHAGGINGLSSKCRTWITTLRQQRDLIQDAADHYREALTATKPLAVPEIAEATDDELAERVRAAKAEEAA